MEYFDEYRPDDGRDDSPMDRNGEESQSLTWNEPLEF